ncbi:BTAD domain-containing putative transcriptional regulator [Nonomuraea sp. CA-218870]|uniref:AfsR/SARP family transcriptional regulator n=1 Tax=Nonomuraea sp. CA-218870 TaxID=3239998 RepID=UPI003D939F75
MQADQTRLGVLGPLEVRIGGRQVSLPAGKHRVLLAALLLRANRTVRTDELIDYVWDGAPPAGARGTVQTYMARLRAALHPADVIVTQSDGYLIETPDTTLDLNRFRDLRDRAETAVAHGRAAESALLRQALALWRGPALADVPSETLRTLAALPLAEERLATLERRIEADLSLGRHRQVVAELRTLTAEHPLHERFWGQLVMALHGSGRQAEALEAFRRLRRLLHDELGIEPGEDLQDLHRQVLNGTPALPLGAHSTPAPRPWRASCHLPPDLGAYAGRAELVEEGVSLMVSPARRTVVPILAVCGAPGTGKTALAVRIAHRVRSAFPDGQWFVRLRDAEGRPRDPSDMLAEALLAAGVDRASLPDDLAARAARLRAELAGRSLLLVLDDAAEAAQIRPLLPGVAGCAVLVTSRTDLGGLAALHDARVVTLGPLRRAESVGLLAELVPGGEAGDEHARAEIARLCGDLPLALRLAAANLIGRSPAEASRYLARLRSGDPLGALTVAGDHEASIRAAYDRSYSALPPAARRLFRLLAKTPGDITLDAAAALLAASAGAAEPLLATLTAAHLLRRSGAGDRYRLDRLLRLYAAERLAAEEPLALPVPDGRGAAVRLPGPEGRGRPTRRPGEPLRCAVLSDRPAPADGR